MQESSPATQLQQAALLHNPGPSAQVTVQDHPVAYPGSGEVLVKLTHSGICGSELRALHGWGKYDEIIGHEGVGSIVKLGDGVPTGMLGKRVGVKWLYRSCGECATCQRGFVHICPQQMNTGRSCPGTLQQFVVADSRHLTEIPDTLPGEIAAPLLCAGLTMMGAIGQLPEDVVAGDWLVIIGSGGGLGHIGVQIAAKAKGLKVIAVDTGASKRSISLDSGATAFVDYATQDVAVEVKNLTGEGAAAVIVVSDSEQGFRLSAHIARPLGTILLVGLPPESLEIPISVMMSIRKRLTIKGVLVGSEEQMREVLQYAVDGIVKPSVEVLKLAQVGLAIDRLRKWDIPGRIVIALPE